jgi:MoaA/NifB/PqqE/SkfB family radical SAM enzyme
MDYASLKAQNKALNYSEIRAGATRIKSRPLFFWFDIAGPCNLECAHCGYRIHGRTSDQEVSETVYAEVLRELMPTAYICNLGGTNWGEMTIAKSFPRFLQDCKKYQVKINLTTNGTRMTDEWFDDLLDTLCVIGFSMEGMEEQFEKMRGFKWRFFLKHVEKVCRGRADRGKTFRVEWRFCAHSENIHQLPAMIKLAKSIGVDRIQVMNLTPYVPAQKYKMLYYHRSLANTYFAEGRKLAQELGVVINIPPDFDIGTFDTTLVQLGGLKNGPQTETDATEMVHCYHPWQTCSINELGHLKPCCVYWKPMGDIGKSGFFSVWNGRRYRKLRASINAPHPDSICYSCRLPRFDSEENISFGQVVPGVRELVRKALTFRRNRARYAGVMNEEFDPTRPSPAGAPERTSDPVLTNSKPV